MQIPREGSVQAGDVWGPVGGGSRGDGSRCEELAFTVEMPFFSGAGTWYCKSGVLPKKFYSGRVWGEGCFS